MGFILDGLESEHYDRSYSDRDLFRRIGRYFKPFRAGLALVGIVIAAASLAEFAAQLVIAKSLDVVAGSSGFRTLALLAAAVIGFGVVEWLFNYARHFLSGRIVGRTIWKLRSDVFDRAMKHDLSFYDENTSGKVVSRITTDTEDFAGVINLVTDFLSQVLLLAFFFSYLVRISLKLSLIMLAMAPVAFAVAMAFRKLARFVTMNAKRVTAEVNGGIAEAIAGISVAKGFRRERTLWESFKKDNQLSYRFHLRRGIVLQLIFPAVVIASGFGNGLIVMAGGGLVRSGGLSLGQWFFFMQAVAYFWWPLLNIASFWSQLQDGLAAAERVFSLIDREPKVKQCSPGDPAEPAGAATASWTGAAPACAPQPVRSGGLAVSFRKVRFAYSDKELVLPDFSLDIPAGQKLAVVGATGAGKSSIVKLLCRFYEFQFGSIQLGGADIRAMNLDVLRGEIGLVAQTPFLFPGSILDNIRYARPDATDDQVMTAARHLGRGDWIDDLPEGLKTETGHRGSAISMGQRQLVSLARILLKDPAVFILDEATSSVDPFTEAQIQEGLETVMQGRTAIVIAHRLSTIRNSDRTIVLEKGQIMEDGNHASLLRAGGYYARLYDTYFRHQSLEYILEQSS